MGLPSEAVGATCAFMSGKNLPQVIIIGRPNVGKSTLFNRLVGKKLALVDNQPGVTRDRRFGAAGLVDLEFEAVDTAGWEDEDAESLPGRMRAQTEVSVQGADAALFVMDARAGITPLDEEIARWLRTQELPVIVVANKCEGRAADAGIYECYALGLGDPIPVSAEHGEGMSDLYSALTPHIGGFEPVAALAPAPVDEEEEFAGFAAPDLSHMDFKNAEEAAEAAALAALEAAEAYAAKEEAYDHSAPLSLAIVGRPNAGKSTLINCMLGEDRLLTGPEAGITRDAISTDWEWTDPASGEVREVKLVDTAGMRKRAKVQDKLEQMSVADAKRAIDFAEVVVLVLDATRGLEVQDLKIASAVLDEGRALMIAINKWDIAEHPSSLFNGIRAALEEGLSQLRGVPLISVSAITGKGLDTLISAAYEVRKSWSTRVSTSALNRWFDDSLGANPPPAPNGRRIKLRYITQIKTRPPSFVCFGTRLHALPKSYERYMINGIRKSLGFGAVPVRLTMRSPKNPYVTKQR